MSDVKLCRICLVNDVRLYNYNRYFLKQYYEDVMAVGMKIQDGLPDYFCYECACILHKFHKFKEKCQAGLKLLEELLQNGPITQKSIINLDRKTYKLESSLDLIVVNNNVKTYIVKSNTLNISESISDDGTENLHEIEEIKLPKIEQVDTDYDSEDSLDLAQYKNVIIQKDNEQTTNDNVKVMIGVEKNNDVSDFNISDDDKSDTDIQNTAAMIETTKRNNNKRKKRLNKENKKMKRFEHKAKSNLDPEHWLKIILTEDEAVEEFRARELDPKYLAANYKCTECYKGFSKEDMLNRHQKLRHSESLGPIVCRFCSMRFKWKCFLTKHISQHYTKYKCLRCELMCPLESTAIFHNDYHNGVTRKCRHCDQEFRHLSTYYTHLRTHRSEHVCTLCGASFVSEIGLAIHKRTMHINTVINPEEDVNTYCERCGIKFETRKAYEKHVFHSAKHAEGIEELVEPNEVLAEPKMNSKGRRKDVRRNPRKFTTCGICNKNFSAYAAYLKHHSAEHRDLPVPRDGARHICEICGASLASGSVISHLNTHTRDRLHTCQACGMQFSTKGSMIRHQLTHTGEKPFECSMCDKRFTQQSSMKLHYRTFHLKEPYPKRNRKKKTANPPETPIVDDFRNDETEENLKIARWH